MQAGESLALFLAPCDKIRAPHRTMAGVFNADAGCVDVPPMRIERQPEPLLNLWHCLRGKLSSRADSDYNLAVFAGRLRPVDNHGNQGGFADAVAGCDRDL